ncbi:uncharacterized protein proser2 [Centroberyx gerrardi]
MSKGQLTSDPVTMDVHLQANPPLHFGVNGAARRNSRPSEDETLQFLSQEEQECILFFEETIVSLEESLEEDEQKQGPAKPPLSSSPIEEVDGPPTLPSAPSFSPGPMSSFPDIPPSPKDQDIIDLVQPEPDLVQTKEPLFHPTIPDFQTMAVNPDSHFEMKPRRDPMDGLPLEYNPPLPSGSYGPADSHFSYHPPGCIPTPVLIAQKIAENQASGTSSFHPSSLLRHSSLESDKPPSYSSDHSAKQGPPTSVKPTRFPANISVMLGSKEHHNQSLANVNIQERRAQMLANLTGTSHPLELEDPQQVSPQKSRNVPTRSVSFRDPTPDKSRQEALSKLGLTRNRAMSGGMSVLITPNSTIPPLTTDTETSTEPPVANIPSPIQSQSHADRKPETVLTNSGDKTPQMNPSPPATVTQSSYPPPPSESKPPVLPAPPPEVASLDFNSYGGKTIVVNPSASSKSEPAVSTGGHDSKTLPSALANPSDFNSFGGKTKVMATASVPMTRSDLPDILSSHIDKSRTLPSPTKPETLPYELNSYGGKTRTITPSTSSNPPSFSPARTSKAPAPTPAPRPARHHPHQSSFSPQKVVGRPPSPESRRRSISKPASFRSQGITVQFSGRGATDESRREALRKLGLLKDTY